MYFNLIFNGYVTPMKNFSQSHTIPTTTKTSDQWTGVEPLYESMKFFLFGMSMMNSVMVVQPFFCVSGVL